MTFPLVQIEFDLKAGFAAQEAGLDHAAEARRRILALARGFAVGIARGRPDRTCTADDVQWALIRQGADPGQLGNAAGRIFTPDRWEFTGEWRPSERVSNHGHKNRVWRMREGR